MNLTTHFTLEELNGAGAPAAVRTNLQSLATLLELVRGLNGGQPLVVTSGYRPGDPRQHGSGSAADMRVPGRDPVAFANRVAPSLSPNAFGQMIVYPWTTRHVHLSLPNGAARGQYLVETGKGVYVRWTPGTPVPRYGTAANAAPLGDGPANEGAASLEGLLYLLGGAALLFYVLR